MAVESMLKKGISPSSWHHAPEHRFIPGKTYLVTGATLYKQHFLASSERLGFLQSHLFDFATRVGWNLQAWAIFSNHYHFIAESLLDAYPLSRFIQRFHSDSARLLNLKDDQIGRKVWYQYWDRYLTFETSYLARLNYVNNNAVKHGLVAIASQYPFCSAGWFEAHCSHSFQRKVASFGYERLNELDDFDPIFGPQ